MSKTRKVPKRRAPRYDGWENTITGLGIFGRDKRLGAAFTPDLVSQEICEQTWRGDDMFARMIETVPNEGLREGFEISVEGDKALCEALDEEHRRLDTREIARKAWQYARAYGGAGILLGADDGETNLELPLNEDRIREFKSLAVFTPRELHPARYYSDILDPRYGNVAVYRLLPWYAPPGADVRAFPLIHESRIARLPGEETSRRARLTNIQPGWEDSILVRVGQVISDFQAAWQGASIILQDFAPPVLKLKGLAKILAAQKDASDTALTTRARMLELSRSIARTTIIDSEEEYGRETVNVTGYADLLEKLMLRLAAAAQMPVSLLFGQAPAGLTATGDSDIRWFYDQVAAMQERKLRPVLNRITELMLKAKAGPSRGIIPENWDIRFHPLWQMGKDDETKLRYQQAQADALYIQNQVLTPEEVAKSRFGGDAYSLETQLDIPNREAMSTEPDIKQPEGQTTKTGESSTNADPSTLYGG